MLHISTSNQSIDAITWGKIAKSLEVAFVTKNVMCGDEIERQLGRVLLVVGGLG